MNSSAKPSPLLLPINGNPQVIMTGGGQLILHDVQFQLPLSLAPVSAGAGASPVSNLGNAASIPLPQTSIQASMNPQDNVKLVSTSDGQTFLLVPSDVDAGNNSNFANSANNESKNEGSKVENVALPGNDKSVGSPPSLDLEDVIFVNALQYKRILIRRAARARLERERSILKKKKPYLHESRHRHTNKRTREANGRFASSKLKPEDNHTPKELYSLIVRNNLCNQ